MASGLINPNKPIQTPIITENQSQAGLNQNEPTNEDQIQGWNPSTQTAFKVPTNLVEHNQIIANLVATGSSYGEAEQVVAGRKIAFNNNRHRALKLNRPFV